MEICAGSPTSPIAAKLERDLRHSVNSQAVCTGNWPRPCAMLGLSLFGGGYGSVHQAEDHRRDGGGADGGGLGRRGSRVKENGATT
jgi:hypothetical protein